MKQQQEMVTLGLLYSGTRDIPRTEAESRLRRIKQKISRTERLLDEANRKAEGKVLKSNSRCLTLAYELEEQVKEQDLLEDALGLVWGA